MFLTFQKINSRWVTHRSRLIAIELLLALIAKSSLMQIPKNASCQITQKLNCIFIFERIKKRKGEKNLW